MQKIEIGTLLKRERVHTYTYKSTKIEHPVKSLGGFTRIKATSPLKTKLFLQSMFTIIKRDFFF